MFLSNSFFLVVNKKHGRPMAQSNFKQDIITSENELYIYFY